MKNSKKRNKKKLILLVEDDLPIIDVYSIALREIKESELEVIKTGQGFLDWIEEFKRQKKEKPGLILLDLVLPDISGIHLLKKIREEAELKTVSVFVITNYTDKEAEEEIKKIGVEKYFVKTKIGTAGLIKEVKKHFLN